MANLRNFDQMSSYNLNLSVSDGIYSAFTKLKVGLVSANSYAPVFEKKSYKVQFAEGQPEGVRIAGKFTIYSCHNFWWNYSNVFAFLSFRPGAPGLRSCEVSPGTPRSLSRSSYRKR